MRRYIPRAVKRPLREGLNRLHTWRYIRANPDAIIPPASMDFVGGGDFQEIGQEFLTHFRKLGALQPHHHVLDVGCGFGRMAVALTGFLNDQGSYEGFDVVPVGINWCQDRITPRFPNFRFQLADIHNTHYNPGGRQEAASYVFPYEDRRFDFVLVTSVFTHLLPEAQIHYLSEISRVLKDDGRVLMTFLLLNEEAEKGVATGKSALTLDHAGVYQDTTYLFASAKNPEETIAYPEDIVLARITAAGLAVVGPVHYGHWSGRDTGASFQDIVVATKKGLASGG